MLSPPSARIEPGFRLEIKCTLPNAVPQAKLSWLKNNEEIESSQSIAITKEGSLIIQSAKVQDTGNFSCAAENIVGKRISDPVPVLVRNEKRWSEWSSCTADCLKYRERKCNPKAQDECHGKEVESIECKDGLCEEKIPDQSSSDRIVYYSLIIVSVLCVVMAALFAHSRRQKHEIPDYIVTDNGKFEKLVRHVLTLYLIQ